MQSTFFFFFFGHERWHSQAPEIKTRISFGGSLITSFYSKDVLHHDVRQKMETYLASSITAEKEPAFQYRNHKRCRFRPWVGKMSWRRAQQPTPVFLPAESHAQRNFVGYSPWSRK